MAYGGGFFERSVAQLEWLGLTDVLLPFFLVFTVVYAIMQKTEILGEGKKNFNIVIALVMAFAVVVPHIMGVYPPGADVVVILNKALPNVSLIIIAVLMVLLLIGIFGWKVGGAGTSISGIIALIAFIVVVYIFGAAANIWRIPTRWAWLHDPDTQAIILVLLVFGILVWFITKEEDTAGESMVKKIGETMGELFSKN